MNHAQFVGHVMMMRQPIGDPEPALTASFPFSFAFQDRRVGFPHGGDGTFKAIGQSLAGQIIDGWLSIKQIQMAGPTLHEQPDHVLGTSHVVCCGLRLSVLLPGDPVQGDCAESHTAVLQKTAAGRGALFVEF